VEGVKPVGNRTVVELKELMVKALLGAAPDCKAIYLFGSWGTADQRSDSDIDLAILPAAPLAAVYRWELAQELSSALGCNVDLIDLLSASTVLRMQIIANGELLYGFHSSEVEQFADMVFSSYARLNEERREILTDVLRRGNVYGK
jgi:uncharacterized protein